MLDELKRKIINKKWRTCNTHNNTYVGRIFDFNKVSVGYATYGILNPHFYESEYEKIEIGNYCSIADNVKLIAGGNHDMNSFSTFPFSFFYEGEHNAISKGKIIIKDDVWIGENSLILSGVTIGQGAVVAAGSVVTKNVGAYEIVGGVPAKIIKKRFSEEICKELEKIDYSKLNKKKYIENKDLLKRKINTIDDAKIMGVM